MGPIRCTASGTGQRPDDHLGDDAQLRYSAAADDHQQTAGTFGSNSFDVRIVSDTPMTWATSSASCSALGLCGWYLDLTNPDSSGNPVQGEKMVANPILRGGRLIFVTTIPSLSRRARRAATVG